MPSSRPHQLEISVFNRSPQNLLRITTTRIFVQTIVFLLFLSFVLLNTFANLDEFPGLRYWVSKILEIDPLIALSTAITTHTVYRGLLWSLLILIPTLFLGRFFCGWICPYGALHHFVHWAFGGYRKRQRHDANQYRPMFAFKYYLLAAMLAMAVFGSLQIGLLDPICLIYRSFTGSVLPALNLPAQQLAADNALMQRTLGNAGLNTGAWLIGSLLFLLVALNLVIPRFFCRVLCPLGALLGVLSRFAWWRIERDPERCDHCELCTTYCEGACDPHKELRKSECFVCFNCIEDCPCGALSFKFLPPREHEIASPEVSRRRIVFATLLGVLLYPFNRATGKATRDFSSKVIRPPGTVEELEFLERCLKCDQCLRVCPTNVLQPAWFEAGLEGLWTPVMNYRMGHCQLNCTACGQVCPSGAIQRLSVDQKRGLGEYAEHGPIKVGTAHIDPGRCLPFSKNIPCVVCEEVCPVSPKAIHTERQLKTLRDGRKIAVESSGNTVKVAEWPGPGQALSGPPGFSADQFAGDETTSYHVLIRHVDGQTETQRIAGNTVDTLTIEGRFSRPPEKGASVTLKLELKVPFVDTALCIGCGLCEKQCPVAGDRRAIYVTPDGETRSQYYGEEDRNRSLRLLKK